MFQVSRIRIRLSLPTGRAGWSVLQALAAVASGATSPIRLGPLDLSQVRHSQRGTVPFQ
jgi:hypothetical protein